MDYDVKAEGEFFTDWITDRAIEYIRRPRSKPFFHYLSIPDPHTPITVGPPYDTMYKPEDMPVPSTLYQENLPDWAVVEVPGIASADGLRGRDQPENRP